MATDQASSGGDGVIKLHLNGVYRHSKGNLYWLIGVLQPRVAIADHLTPLYQVMHSESEEILDVYIDGVRLLYLAPPNSPYLIVYQEIDQSKPSPAPKGRWGRPLEMFRSAGRFTLVDEAIEPCYYDPTIAPPVVSMHHCPVCGEMVISGVPHP